MSLRFQSRLRTTTSAVPQGGSSAPVNTAVPLASLSGNTFTTTNGTWTNSPTGYTYQWKKDGVAISGETSSTLAKLDSFNGTSILCTVTATNAGGSTSANSNALAVGMPWLLPAYFSDGTYFPVALTESNGNFGTTFDPANFREAGTTYYVATTGNDTTGDGSSGNPWATISKAFNTIATGSKLVLAPGRYVPPLPTEGPGAGKNISVSATTLGTVFVGNILSESQITWGTLASGRQTATLASGTVAGFVDLTKTKFSVPMVSRYSSTAAGIATLQAGGDAGVFRSTPSQVGTSDSRDLTGKGDTEVILWPTGANTRYFSTASGGRLMLENIVLVGNLMVSFGISTQVGRVIEYNCWNLGGDALVTQDSTAGSSIIFKNVVGVGSQGPGPADLFDINANYVFDTVTGRQCCTGGADQEFTSHAGLGMVVNCDFSQNTGSSGVTGREGRQGIFGTKMSGTLSAQRAGYSANYNWEGHTKGNVYSGSPTNGDVLLGTLAQNTALYVYDAALDGKTITPGSPIDRRANRPTGIQTSLSIDLSQTSTLFQDTAGTVPVTAAGQTVSRINCSAGTGGYITLQAGTAVYGVSSGKAYMTLTNARFVVSSGAPFNAGTAIVCGLRSTDTTFIFASAPVSGQAYYLGDFRSTTGSPFSSIVPFPATKAGGVQVDLSSTIYTTPAIKSTICDGTSRVMSLIDVDLGWTPWRGMSVFAGTSAGTNSLNGDIYACRWVWNYTGSELDAVKTAVKALMP